jgi:hypothetical protein
MGWSAVLCDEFLAEFEELESGLRDELLAQLRHLETFGPKLGRPKVDTVKGSNYANMKELRFTYQRAPYRYLFAFDPARRAVVLVGGNKAGDRRFYKRLIPIADARFAGYLRQRDDAGRPPRQ